MVQRNTYARLPPADRYLRGVLSLEIVPVLQRLGRGDDAGILAAFSRSGAG